jgi:uncharacterized membrane protein (DUF441 family)
MNDAIRGLLLSKKFIAAISGVVVALATKKGFHLDTDMVGVLLSPIVAYIVSQGIADKGKAAAVIEAAAQLSKDADSPAGVSGSGG